MEFAWSTPGSRRTGVRAIPSPFLPLRAILVACCVVFAGPLASPAASATGTPAPADTPPVRTTSAIRVTNGLNDDVWRDAASAADFLQREPNEGAAPSQRTEFRVAYDASRLYVRVRAFDTDPGKIAGYLTRRDEDSPSDWIHVMIDSYHDRRTAYEFAVNPAGVKADRYWFNDTNDDRSWDAVWDVSVSRDASGWTAEFRIPFSQLRFSPSEANTFGFAVVRDIGRLKETSTWPLLARSASGFVSSFGELGGLTMTAAPKRLELVPYTVANLTRQPTAGNPLLDRSAADAALGLDFKYALTSGLTLTSTINPDFGQVEADPAVVNLTAFETFFSERRPFFVEGSGNFQLGLDCPDCNGLFYSRRVGRSPQGTGELPSGDHIYTDVPPQTTILGAAKLTGRIGRFSIGALQAVTQQEAARVMDGPNRFSRPVEPLASYSVARARREFANQSSIGFMLTAANRRLVNGLEFLPRRAYSGGVDWDGRFKSDYSLTGIWAGSSVRGDARAIADLQENSRHYFQRPDLNADHLDTARTSLDGDAGRIGISKIGGKKVHFNFSVGFKSPGFDVNDLGFFRRADERTTRSWVQIRSDVPTRWFRNRSLNFNQFAAWNADGDRLENNANINGNVTFVNNWEAGGGTDLSRAAFDDRLTRGGPGGRVEGLKVGWVWMNTDNRRPVFMNIFVGGGRDGLGSWFRDINPDLSVRPMTALTLTTGVNFSRNTSDHQWVARVTDTTDHYVFSRLQQTTVGVTMRANYTVSPTLSLQLYAQPFVSGGGYTGFKELIDGRNPNYLQRYAPFAYRDNPDFNYKSFRTTNVLRWELRPGSTLFVVWQQGREDSASNGDFRFKRDFRGIFGVQPRNVLLVKLAYWFNY